MTRKTLRLDGEEYAIVKDMIRPYDEQDYVRVQDTLCFCNEYEEYRPSEFQVGGKVIAYTVKPEGDKKLRMMPAEGFSRIKWTKNLNALGLYEITRLSLFKNRDVLVTLRKINEKAR